MQFRICRFGSSVGLFHLCILMPNPLIEKVLQKFPDVDRNSLVFPTEAVDWDEQGLELFIGSGGFLKPKKKPAAAVAPATPVESGVTAAGGGVAPLAPLTKSAWWVNNSNPAAKIRLRHVDD